MAKKKGGTKKFRISKRLDNRRRKLKTKRDRKVFTQARRVVEIKKKLKAGGKLSKSDARTIAKFRKYQAKNHERLMRKKTQAQKKGIKKAQKSYTTSKRSHAARLAWVTRRKKYGKSGRADPSSFSKGGKKGGSGKKSGGKKSGGKKGGKKSGGKKKGLLKRIWGGLSNLIQGK